ncbi:MAG TPA: hypothetical protein VGZ02_15755 [Candidatus Baltobacteraceae bacterium]|jgi:hypothetical protein|nr:hypothetical protein [Candidatus Baltobacteraceae bacterium]
MLRKLSVLVFCVALTLADCGHQVTPDRSTGPSGLSSGQMQIKFSTQGTLDFTNFWYIIAINTGQNPMGVGEPYAFYATQQYNYRNLDFEMIVASQNGVPSVTIYPFVNQTGASGGTVKVPATPILYTPQDLQLYANCNGQQTQFCITFNRSILLLPNMPTPSPCTQSSTSPSPSPTGSASPSPSPSASPSASPSGSPPPSSGSCTWYLNWWVASPGSPGVPGGQVVDAPGPQGPLDQSFFNFTVDTTQTASCSYASCLWTAVLPGWPAAPSSSAQISGGQVVNAP